MTDYHFPHLSDIGFQRIAPSPALRPFVQWYWHIQSDGRLQAQRSEFMHPDGSMGLVFNWGSPLELSSGRYPQTAVLDPITAQSKQLQLTGHIEAFGILFQPAGAFPLFGQPMPELTAIEAIPGHFQLYEQLYETPTLAGKVTLVEKWLASLLAQAQPLSPLIHPSLTLLTRTNGRLPIQQLAQTLHITPRQLERLYQQQVGLSPKKLAQLLRVRRARTALKQETGQSLAQTAHDHGFYDQAHFIREFKSVTGLTPGQYLARHQQRQRLLQPHENHPL